MDQMFSENGIPTLQFPQFSKEDIDAMWPDHVAIRKKPTLKAVHLTKNRGNSNSKLMNIFTTNDPMVSNTIANVNGITVKALF